MTKLVTFDLGESAGTTTRQLTITRFMRAGDDTAPAAESDADAGANNTVAITLLDNEIWQAVLVDTLTGGGTRDQKVLNFHTGSVQFPGPKGEHLSILHMEDLSSSSSSSSVSSSSSTSSSASTSSESSSTSSSSSISASSSSISTSSESSSTSSSSTSSSSESSGSSGL